MKAIGNVPIETLLKDLDQLCQEEYSKPGQDYGLLQLLADKDHDLALERLQRLTGVMLKRRFAMPHPVEGATSATRANRQWHWDRDRLESSAPAETPELGILDELRRDLPRSARRAPTWEGLAFEAEHERGLYKLLVLWIADKWQGKETESIRNYIDAKESPRFESILDVADTVSQAAITGGLAALGISGDVAVPLVLIAAQYGYRKIFDKAERGDDRS